MMMKHLYSVWLLIRIDVGPLMLNFRKADFLLVSQSFIEIIVVDLIAIYIKSDAASTCDCLIGLSG